MTEETTKTETAAELLPCPFCGGKPSWGLRHGFIWHTMNCDECGIAISDGGNYGTTVEKWNIRAARPKAEASDAGVIEAAEVDFVTMILTKNNVAAQNVFAEARTIGRERKWENEPAHNMTLSAQNAITTVVENALRVGFDTAKAALAAAKGKPGERWGSGVALIAAERQRQMDAEGWTPEHDDEHDKGELARAAAWYALTNDEQYHPLRDWLFGLIKSHRQIWPWDWSWWKPTPNDRTRELVKAGALIAAEIDRLQRLHRPADEVQGNIAATSPKREEEA